MKLSLIIVAYKAKEQLDRCLASLAAHSPEDAEIIVVDNSPERTELEIKTLVAVYRRLIIIWDGTNRGFAEGCNEGARHATGEHLVFINPDTVVYTGWAERMLAHLRPEVGAIGPISNFVAGHQNAVYHMQNNGRSWEEMARLAAKGMHRRGVDTKMLIGFFLLVPRPVWDRVGGMDPALFLGCDDLDLSLRLRDLGYELIIASDVFVYHEGHTSFYAMGTESVALNRRTEKVFLEKLNKKYNGQIPTSTELWGCEILPTLISKPMTLSVCMIVRDEAKNLAELLPQLGFADEVVIVDTGMIPDTMITLCGLDILKHEPGGSWATEGAYQNSPHTKFSHLPWTDDFAAARNFALSQCTCDYVLWLDADDRVPAESAALIRAALDSPGPLTALKLAHFAFKLRDHLPSGRLSFTDQPRLFPRLPGIKWEDTVHESYMISADRLNLILAHSPEIIIDHHGYQDAAVLAQKHERNIRLLEMQPDTPMKFYQLGKHYGGLRRFQEARLALQECLERDWNATLARDFRHHVRYLLALQWYQDKGLACPEMDPWLLDNPKPDALFLRAERAFVQGRVDEAEALYTEYSKMNITMDFYGTDYDTFVTASEARLDMIERLRAEYAYQRRDLSSGVILGE